MEDPAAGPVIPTRAEAYLAALAKVSGREFDPAGRPVLTEGERQVLRGLEREDFAEAFQRVIGQRVAMARLAAIFRGARK